MAALTYEVTAAGLNLRDQPSKEGRILEVLSRGRRVVASGPELGGWLPAVANGSAGFVATGYLRALDPLAVTSAPPVSPPAAPSPAPTTSPDVSVKDRDLSRLHPKMRAAVEAVLQQCQAEALPFRVFEANRSPERQAWLYAQGRTRPGSIVTKAEAWQSFHQYGLAVDFVLFENNQWSWDDKGPRAHLWKRLPQVIAAAGLRSLNWEAPHAEWPTTMVDLQYGRWPDDGDASWYNSLEAAVDRWQLRGLPGAPGMLVAERPPLLV
jgi:hypothetical protein